MSEPITFFSESFRGGTTYYDVHEHGMVYRPDNDDGKTSFVWGNVSSIEDRSRGWIFIVLNDQKEIPIRYTTNNFEVFLKTICLRLSDNHKEDFRTQDFRLTPKYLYQLRLVVLLLVLAIIVSFQLSTLLSFLLLTLFIPLGVFFQRQPISLTLDDHCLTLHYLHKQKAIDYKEIVDADFEVVTNDYGSTLTIRVRLKGGKTITIKKLEDSIVFFVLLQVKLNENMILH